MSSTSGPWGSGGSAAAREAGAGAGAAAGALAGAVAGAGAAGARGRRGSSTFRTGRRSRCTRTFPPRGRPQPDEAAHREADEVHAPGPELLDQRDGVGVDGLHADRLELARRAVTLAAVVVRDAPVAAAQVRDLRREHRRVHEEAVAEEHALRALARVLVVEAGAVHVDEGHIIPREPCAREITMTKPRARFKRRAGRKNRQCRQGRQADARESL
jgi:hypothetical protein